MNDTKQVILIRRDLKLKRASIAALAAKASAEFLFDNNESDRHDALRVEITPQEAAWMTGNAKRIVLGVPSEIALRSIAAQAENSGLSCYSLSGSVQCLEEKDFFDEMLCVAIGPDDAEKIDELTGNLKLI